MVRFSFFKNTLLIILPLTMLVCFSCGGQNSEKKNENQDKQVKKQDANIVVAATQFSEYAEFLKNKKVGVVANQTSIAKDDIHLVDFLLSEGIAIQKIFSPEHGFRGSEDAGAEVKDGKDTKTGLPILGF